MVLRAPLFRRHQKNLQTFTMGYMDFLLFATVLLSLKFLVFKCPVFHFLCPFTYGLWILFVWYTPPPPHGLRFDGEPCMYLILFWPKSKCKSMIFDSNTSLTAKGALTHRLQCHTKCPKWPMGSGQS